MSVDPGPIRDVELVEVSPRDGLQNESKLLPTATKLELIGRAVRAGARRIEVASFVHPERVPQMADAEAVALGLQPRPDVIYAALVLNERGYDRALSAGLGEVNTVVSATETFSQRNQGISAGDALAAVGSMRERAAADGVSFTVTISVAFGCPFEGEVAADRLADVAARVAALGPDEIALADTIGVAVPTDVERRFELLRGLAPTVPMRAHLHDTRNTGIANAIAAVRAGVPAIDASIAGIGGCPFAPAATGNVATEDVAYALGRMGYDHHLDLEELIGTARWLARQLEIEPPGMVSRAGGFP